MKDPAEVKLKHSPVPKSQPETSKTTDEIQLIDATTTQQLLNITTTTLRRLQKQDKFCKKKVHEIKTGTPNEFYCQQWKYIKKENNCKQPRSQCHCHPKPCWPTLCFHEFHNCKGHQGSARTFNMPKHKFWWKGMRLDVKNHINNCISCLKISTKYCMPPPTAFRDTKSIFCMHSNRHHWQVTHNCPQVMGMH